MWINSAHWPITISSYKLFYKHTQSRSCFKLRNPTFWSSDSKSVLQDWETSPARPHLQCQNQEVTLVISLLAETLDFVVTPIDFFNGAKLKHYFFHVCLFLLHCEEALIHWSLGIVGDNNGYSSGISYPSCFALPHHLARWSDSTYLNGCPLSKNSSAVHFTHLLVLFRCFPQKKDKTIFIFWEFIAGGEVGGKCVAALSYGWLGGGRLFVTFNEVKVLSEFELSGFLCVCYQQGLAGIPCV